MSSILNFQRLEVGFLPASIACIFGLQNKHMVIAILMAASRTSSVEHEWHTSLIVLHCCDFSLIRGEPACCGPISLGCEIGPAEDQTHV